MENSRNHALEPVGREDDEASCRRFCRIGHGEERPDRFASLWSVGRQVDGDDLGSGGDLQKDARYQHCSRCSDALIHRVEDRDRAHVRRRVIVARRSSHRTRLPSRRVVSSIRSARVVLSRRD